MIMTGLNITVSVYRRIQEVDDAIGGSVQRLAPIRTGIPARISQLKTPIALQMQGITITNLYECTTQSENYVDLNIVEDDVVRPETGQFIGIDFLVTAVQSTSLNDVPNDYRGFHRSLTLKRLIPKATVV